MSSDEITNLSNADLKFDWFTYKGDDLIYRNLSVGKDELWNPEIAEFYTDSNITLAGDYHLVNCLL